MRPGNNNNNRRGRNRGPRKPHGGMPNKNQNFDGGGSDTRVRGNVYQVLEKYLQLARDAGVAGDRVAAENFLQHADHYYRVITTMNDGQRPRVGGREISVADVNVQNVSQGLSAALYSGGPSQPNMSDGNGGSSQQGNGNQRNGDGFNGGQNNAHGDNGQGNGGQGNGGQHNNGQNDNQRGNNPRGNNAHGGDNQGQNGNGSDDQGDESGDEGQYVQPQQQRGNRGRNNNNGGNRSYGQSHNNNAPAAGNGTGNNAVTDREPVVQAAAPAPASDDQPDYPEHLLPNAAPEAAAEGAPAPREASRAPRGRLRTRRPRPGADGEGEAAPEAVAPATDGGE